jgi:hypothetical protein
MKFGGKHTVQSRMAAVESRLGKTTGASKGSKPAPEVKVKPILGKGKIGAKITKRF